MLFLGCSTHQILQSKNNQNDLLYPKITACIQQPINIQINQDLVQALIQKDAEWAQCAAKVDSIISIQSTL